MYLNYSMKQQKITENLNNINNINFQNNYAPQIPTSQIQYFKVLFYNLKS